MILSKGEHLVKITSIQEGRSESKGTPYFLLRFENPTGFIEQRIYESDNNAKFISKLFDAVDLAFNDLLEWKPQIVSLIGKYLLITVVENVRDDIKNKEVKYLAVYKFNHVSKKYSYYSEECHLSGEYDYADHQFQANAGDELVPADIKRRYFTSFEHGQHYAFTKYNEIAHNRYGSSDLERIVNLFKIHKGPPEKNSTIVIHVDGRAFKYLNEVEKLNDSLENIELEYWYYDELGRTIFENRQISFVTKEAAKKFIDAFYADGNTGNDHVGYKTSSLEKQQEDRRNSSIESAFDEKYIENFLL